MPELRYDLGSLRPAKRTKDGLLRVEAHITRTGVFEYRNRDGSIRREYRPPEEVFHPDALESFAQVPVTNEHPPEEVTSKNAKRYSVGAAGERIVRDDDHVRAPLVVMDDDTIADMEARRKVEVSCGYRCDIDPTPGVAPDGTKYDAVQRNIRGNHIAIVEVGRAGRTARVRMDAVGVLVHDEPATRPIIPGGAMPDPKNKTKDKLTLEGAAQAVADAETKLKTAEEALAAERRRADEAQGRCDDLQQEIEALKSNRVDAAELSKKDSMISNLQQQLTAANKARADAEDPARLRAAVKRRVHIETSARAILGAEFVTDAASDRELMCAVIERKRGVGVESDVSDDYVRARFDSAVEQHFDCARVNEQLGHLIAPRVDEINARTDSRTAHQKMIERNRNAGVQPLNATKGA